MQTIINNPSFLTLPKGLRKTLLHSESYFFRGIAPKQQGQLKVPMHKYARKYLAHAEAIIFEKAKYKKLVESLF